MAFQTKKEIEGLISQMQFLVKTINHLIENMDGLCAVLKSDRAGLSNHLKNIQVTLSEARELFIEQIALYTLLAKQVGLTNVEEAEATLVRIKGIEYQIIMKKGRLKYQTSVLPQFLIVYKAEELPELVAIQKELELVAG
jgi:hypothetical protein